MYHKTNLPSPSTMKMLMCLAVLFICASELRASLLLDNAETGTSTNILGGNWQKFDDGFSTAAFTPNAAPGYTGAYSRLFEWTLKTGSSNPYAVVMTGLNASWTGVDLSSFYGVRFYARGNGRYDVSLATDRTRSGNNHYIKSVNLTPEWKLFELPFAQFAQTWGEHQPWDPTTIYAFELSPVGSYGMSGRIWVDDIEFYYQSEAHAPVDPNTILPEPKINQVGYLPGDKKYFCIASDNITAGDTFRVVDPLGTPIYTAVLSGTPINDVASTGEHVLKTDFSGLTTPGTYRIRVSNTESYPFSISDSIYNNLFKDALRCFYLIRCGLAENDSVSGINRPACHTTDAKIRGGIGSIDATGGWHNAGDKGKFVHQTAISIAQMLWLYELKSAALKDLNIRIPESGNGMSDLLNEAQWGLRWLLKMKRADGSVYHKADAEPNLYYCPEPAPDQDPFNADRYVEFQKCDLPQNPSTIDAADFAAVMSQAGRVFQSVDTVFAARCRAAATSAWTWVSAHKNTGQTDPYYADSVATQEYLWAESEMARTLNSSSLRTQFSIDIDQSTPAPVGWMDPQLFGYVALYYDNGTGATLKNKIKNKFVSLCNSIVSTSNGSGYGVALGSWEYWWESNEWAMSKGNCLIFGYEMTGNAGYRDAALAQLHYILGLNSLNKSFVMSYGSNSMQHPFNCIYTVYGKPFPGWMAGGPNSYIGSADVLLAEVIGAGTPKAKCYLDVVECGLGSWSCNEGETAENAALVFLTGYFYNNGSSNPNGISGFHSNTPAGFSLHQNFPNPFNPSTRIEFELRKPSCVEIKIYTVTGQLVRNLVNDGRPPGKYTATWNGTDEAGRLMPSGVYFYQIGDGNRTEVKKMILLK